MHEKYIKLFEELARTTAITAERVMDYDHDQGDEKGLNTAKTMRDDFQELYDRIKKAGNSYQLTHNDAAKLLVGAMIVINQLQEQVNNIRAAITGYQSDIIPKLQVIVDNSKDDDQAAQMASEKFVIENEK